MDNTQFCHFKGLTGMKVFDLTLTSKVIICLIFSKTI